MEEAEADMLLKAEAMDQGYQPGSNGGEDSNSTDGLHSAGHTMHCPSSRHHCRSSVSWANPWPSKCEDQHTPRDTLDAFQEATEESEGEKQSTLIASPQDENEPAEWSTVSGQESPDATSTRGDPSGDIQRRRR